MHKTMYRRVRYLKLTCYYPAFRCCWKEFSYIVRCTFILFLTFVRSLYIVSLYVAFIMISHKFTIFARVSLVAESLEIVTQRSLYFQEWNENGICRSISTFVEKTGKSILYYYCYTIKNTFFSRVNGSKKI